MFDSIDEIDEEIREIIEERLPGQVGAANHHSSRFLPVKADRLSKLLKPREQRHRTFCAVQRMR
jgi:hypothetical protein